MHNHVLYNPHAGNGQGLARAEALLTRLPGGVGRLVDLTQITDYGAFFASIPEGDCVLLTGGDGTLNRFLNDTQGLELPKGLLYAPTGTGNDFWTDIGKKPGDDPVVLTPYLKDLPSVMVNGRTHRFLNGVGYGIDGYCCERGDALREKSKKPVNYASIAVKGLLFHFKPRNAVITVDGVQHTYRKVWLAPVMFGRYYGGGMIPTPEQDRGAEDRRLSVMVYHTLSKLRALMIFPSIFKGEHVRHRQTVEILTGREITVAFDRPTPLQIDGETISGVTECRASIEPCAAKG